MERRLQRGEGTPAHSNAVTAPMSTADRRPDADVIRVLLADDHDILRDGLRALLEMAGDIAVVGEARTGREAVDEAVRLRPDVVCPPRRTGEPPRGGRPAKMNPEEVADIEA